MKITIKKFSVLFITMFIIVVQYIAFKFLQSSNDVDGALYIASLISIICFVLEIITWKKLTNEIICPYIVFFMVLFIFCCGQSIGWFTGIDMGPKDMWDRVDHEMTRSLLLQGLCYSSLGISFFHLGAILTCKSNVQKNYAGAVNSEVVINAYRNLGKLLIVVCVPAFIAKTYEGVIAVMQGGYGAIYTYKASSSAFMRICSMLGNYYQPCLLLLLIAYRNEKVKRCFIVFAMMLDVVVNLYIGGRSNAVMTILAILLAYHYFVKPFSKKQLLLGSVGGYFGVALLNAVADTRGKTGRGLLDIFTMFGTSLTNVIGEFIGELGWSITSVCWTMNLVPKYYGFRYGRSYIVSLISWIPSFFFSGTHPVVVWGELSNWLQNALHMGYGPGYTMIAEAYLNFGTYGYVALFVEGMIVASVIAKISHRQTENDLIGSTFQIMVVMVLMKSLVRSSVSIAMRQTVLVLLPLYILIRFALKKGRMNNK